MAGQTEPTPPEGYHYQGKLFADVYARFDSNLAIFVWANLLALLPLGAGILLLWLPYQIYRLFGSPLAIGPTFDWPTAVSISAGAFCIIISIIIHESLHLLALLLLGHRPVLHLKYFAASIREQEYLSRHTYLIVSLTPIVVISLLGGVLLLFLPPTIADLLLIALLLNMAASIGDLAVALRVLRAPPRALFADRKGICVFVPLPSPPPLPKPGTRR